MGRPYDEEIEELKHTYKIAQTIDISNLKKFVEKSANLPLYVVASGGGVCAAEYACLLHQRKTGLMSKHLTPFEFKNTRINSNCAVLLISAGGNNGDVLYAFKKIKHISCLYCVLTLKEDSELTTSIYRSLEYNEKEGLQQAYILDNSDKYEHLKIKDGFLATNTLLCTMIMLKNAYDYPFEWKEFDSIVKGDYVQDEDIHTLFILYDNYTKPIAKHLESNFIEGKICNVHITDYRNFGHGQHNWFNNFVKNDYIDKSESLCLGLYIGSENHRILNQTLKHISHDNLGETYIEDPTLTTIYLFIEACYYTQGLARYLKIDVGQPKTQGFQKDLYELGKEI